MGAGLNGIIFDDPERPLTRVSRSLYTYKSNIYLQMYTYKYIKSGATL